MTKLVFAQGTFQVGLHWFLILTTSRGSLQVIGSRPAPSLCLFFLSLWLSLVFNKLREVINKTLNSASLMWSWVGRHHREQLALSVLRPQVSTLLGRSLSPPAGFSLNLARKPLRCIFTFWGTLLACQMRTLQVKFSLCTPARIWQEFYYRNHYFCLSIFPLLNYIDIFHLLHVGIFFRVLAFWFSSKTQNNAEEGNGKTSG